MKSNLLSFSCILVIFLLFSQSLSAQSVADIKVLFNYKYNEYNSFIGSDNEHFYFMLIGKGNKSISVKTFNKVTADREADRLIILPDNYTKSEIVNYTQKDGQIYILSSFENTMDDKTYYFSESFDISSAKSNGDLKKVTQRSLSNRHTDLLAARSENKEYFAYFTLNNKDGNVSNDVLTVFDRHFQVVYEIRDFVDEMTGSNIIDDFIIDNNGKCYLQMLNYKNSADLYSSSKMKYSAGSCTKLDVFLYNQVYEYKILRTDADGNAQLLSVVPVEDKFIKKLFLYNNGNEIYAGGVFSKLGNLNDGGTFSARVDTQPEDIYITDYFEFSDAFIRKDLAENDLNLYEKALTGDNNGLYDYHSLHSIGSIPYKGGTIMMIEQVFSNLSSSNLACYIRCSDYVYAIYTGSDGKMITTFKIPKKQNTFEQLNNNFAYTVRDSRFYFLFGDLPENSSKSDQMFLYEYNSDFERTIHVIPTGAEYEFPVRATQNWVSENMVIAQFQHMMKNMYLLITLK